ncbi:MAG: polysaccharide deacetylase [Deltaproteobacteria bacterium]|nr:polysaccharide deacetylase [Deltaproteobacteria bacterium]
MPKKILSAVISLFLALAFAEASLAATISDLRPVFKPYRDSNKKLKIAIRSFKEDGRARLISIDPEIFTTEIVDEGAIISTDVKIKDWKGTRFVEALYRYTAPAKGIENQGMRSAEENTGGLFLTIDLCPSTKGFDRPAFEATESLATPAPIAIAVSGLWIERHRDEFDWIRKEEAEGRIKVTWMNHSYSHPYDKLKELKENFLLTPGVGFEDEVLRNEKLLLENGITPSVFFRFPGLISDAALLEKLRKLSLIPIGADAWLAKGETPHNGAFILVHGNGNEEDGIERLLGFYGENKELKLLPLKEAFGHK